MIERELLASQQYGRLSNLGKAHTVRNNSESGFFEVTYRIDVEDVPAELGGMLPETGGVPVRIFAH